MAEPLYSIGTWDTDEQAFRPHPNCPKLNQTRAELVQSMRVLQQYGYTCHRYGNKRTEEDGGLRDSDVSVLIERTDGKPESEILKGWER
jgi:hypothetical protein